MNAQSGGPSTERVNPGLQRDSGRAIILWAASVVASALATGCVSEDRNGGPPVPPPSPENAPVTARDVQIGEGETPFRVEFRETGIRLESVADGSRPDPGPTLVAHSDGRFISANAPGWRSVMSVWDARGSYLYSFGGEGEGPGEFLKRNGNVNLIIDGRDRVHIRDGSPGWSLFSSEHEFVRRVPANVMGGLTGLTFIFRDGSALASDGLISHPSHYFRVTDSTGALVRAFGPVADGVAGRELRTVTYFGGDTFWAGPGVRDADAYVLEEWGIDGSLRRSIRREVSWWQWHRDSPMSPKVLQLHIARNGLLYVLARRPTDEYLRKYGGRQIRDERLLPPDRPGSMDEFTEYVLEVIDTGSGELLASDVYTPAQRSEIPRSFFRGSTVGHRYRTGDDGLPFVEIVTLELVRR